MSGPTLVSIVGAVIAGMAGPFCAAVALDYARRIEHGAQIDGETMCAAVCGVLRCRSTVRVPRTLAAVCAGLLLLAWAPFILLPSPAAAARALACAILLVLALIDGRSGLLPDALTLPLLWAGMLLACAGVGIPLHHSVAAAAAGYLFLRALNAAYAACRGRPGMGGGDIKLIAALGAWLGWSSLPGVLLAAGIGGVLFAFALRGSKAWAASLAFGPFLALAGAFGLVGDPVVQFLFCMGNPICTRSV